MKIKVALRAASSTLCIAAGALGASSLSGQAAPGSVPTREQIALPPTDAAPPKAVARLRQADLRNSPCPFRDSSVRVALTRLRFVPISGASLQSAAVVALQGLQPAPGPQPISTLCDLRDAANARLRAAGYISAVEIPPQEITDGEAVFQVVLARLVGVTVKGAPKRYSDALGARVERLKALDPFNVDEAERILLLAGDVPGLNVALSLRSAANVPGEVVGELRVSYSPWLAFANLQNLGSRQIGRTGATFQAEVYGLTGLADRSFVGASSTLHAREQAVVHAGHSFGLGSGGATAGGRVSYAWSRPDIGILDLRSRSLLASVELTAPLVRTVTRTATVSGGLELIEQRVRIHGDGGSAALNRDKLRVAYIRLFDSRRQSGLGDAAAWDLSGSIELRQGLNIFNATNARSLSRTGYTPSRFAGRADATVVRGAVEGSTELDGAFSIAASAQGQMSSAPLLSFEEYSVGNYTIGRGYDAGVTGGDHAFGIRIEPRAQLRLDPRIGTQAFAFYDHVSVWNEDPGTSDNNRSLRSWGGGVRALLPGLLSIEAIYARPTNKAQPTDLSRAPTRFLLSITIRS